MALSQLFLIDCYKIDSMHYLTPADDNKRQTEGMKARGIFSAVNAFKLGSAAEFFAENGLDEAQVRSLLEALACACLAKRSPDEATCKPLSHRGRRQRSGRRDAAGDGRRDRWHVAR